ncbi:MAG: acetate/propionate family kinase [Gammaproteobacteria bacterium]
MILTLNAGSSSIKFALYRMSGAELALDAGGQVEGIGTRPHFIARSADGALLCEGFREPTPRRGHARAFEQIWSWLSEHAGSSAILAVGHRVVQGGPEHTQPVLIDGALMKTLAGLVPLMPLHLPNNIALIQAVTDQLPDLPQVACFDTAFHQGRAPVTERFALPHALFERGVRRYGFHGLSYEFIVQRLRALSPDAAAGRVVVAHLGSGCSMTAIRDGRCVDTSMSFSALDGLPMGTRCGALDPGVLLYLMREDGMGAAELEDLLYKRSGLLGMSGVSNDLRALHASDDPRAAEAIEYFVYRVGQFLGSLAASLGGIDTLVFTAGVGENDAELRARICADAAWLGLDLDASANSAQQGGVRRITRDDSAVTGWVIPTDEELMIARHTRDVVSMESVPGD